MQAVKQTSFKSLLILGPNAQFLSKVRSYSDLDAVAEDFDVNSPEFRAAQAVFNQKVNLDQIKIGKQSAKLAQVTVLNFDIDFVLGNIIQYKIDGIAQAPVNFDSDQATTMAALVNAIQAHPLIATAQVTDTKQITITAQTAGIPFIISDILTSEGISQPEVTIETTTPNHGFVEDLIEITKADDDWYGLIITSRNPAEVTQVSAYLEAKKKLFFSCSDDAEILNPDSIQDIASLLNLKNYQRTVILYNALPDDFADAAWIGRGFPIPPGGLTFSLKELIGITPDKLSDSEYEAAIAKNANVYINVGVGITQKGRTVSGLPIDFVRDLDWLESRIQEEVFTKLVNLEKVLYNDAGIAIILNVLNGVLSQAKAVGVLSSFEEPTAPKEAEIPFNDKAARHLPNVHFKAIMASALETFEIAGVVSL